jgi:hypothetical protein
MTALRTFCETHGLTGDGPRLVSQSAGRKSLAQLFAAMGFRRGAEIGVWEGAYAKQLCEVNPGLELIAVDPWSVQAEYREAKNDHARLQAAYATTRERLESFNCTLLRMTSIEAAQRVADGSLDFVYIDGNHKREFVDADLMAWTRKVRPGGIVSGHDFRINDRKPWIDVPEAVTAFTKSRGIAPWYVLAADKSPSWFWIQP